MALTLNYYPRLAPPGGGFPSQAEASEMRDHKFVLLHKDGHWLVAVGPPLTDWGYQHADLRRATASDAPGASVHGGGLLSITEDGAARFHSRSGAYGRFDPVLLTTDARLALTRALGRTVVVS